MNSNQTTDIAARVGIFVLGALVALVYGWSWLKSFSLFDKPQKFSAEFADIAGLSRNATVNVQGVRVGTVEFMEFTPARKIRVHLKITDPTGHVPQGSKITIQTLGLVGAKYIEIMIPRDANGNAVKAPDIADGTILVPPEVENPVRVELVMNRVASRVDEIVQSIDTNAASSAINNLKQATQKLNNNMDKLKDAAQSVQSASNNIASTSARFGKTADNASVAADRAATFFKQGNVTLADIDQVARDFRGTSGKLNRILDNPNLTGDLRETMQQARQTAELVRGAITDVNTTLKDKDLRSEVLAILEHMKASTDNIKQSMEVVNRLSNDQGLRSDIKDVVRQAKEAMNQASNVLGDPNFKQNLNATMTKVRSAATNVDIASQQIQRVLGQRAPLWKMMFGRPGKIKVKKNKDGSTETTVTPSNSAPSTVAPENAQPIQNAPSAAPVPGTTTP